MPTVDFTDWAVPDLVLTLGGHTYAVHPPSVDRARLVLACAVRSEVSLGLSAGPVPDELNVVLDGLDDTPLGVVTLGQGVYDALVADGHPPATIDRMAYYAMHFWARGKARADAIAVLAWTPKVDAGDGDEPTPKATRRSRSTSGRSTGSASRTPTASTPTTASRQG